jgi:hypothetical protein
MDVDNKNILKNFQVYDNFLSTIKSNNKHILNSLKMMYSIHMQNKELTIFFITKQVTRFFLKLIIIPFFKINLCGKTSNGIILSGSCIEEELSQKLDISLVSLNRELTFNLKAIQIYKSLYQTLRLLKDDEILNKVHMLPLLHRLIDYLLVYHTVDIEDIKFILVENDRLPSHLALIYRMKEKNKKTIKYDNWLIDPVNHNDVYCDIYFYPSLYHKKIIEDCRHNRTLKYVKGGFLSWDRLKQYTHKPEKKIIYFTQFGIEVSTHLKYIHDIINIVKIKTLEYQIFVKIHPKECLDTYKPITEIDKNIELISVCDDVYSLISEADFCFSIFSTVTLESKHIMNNSYFINYDEPKFHLIDYAKLNVDVVKNKEMLEDILLLKHLSIKTKDFIQHNNCTYPDTIENMKELIKYD